MSDLALIRKIHTVSSACAKSYHSILYGEKKVSRVVLLAAAWALMVYMTLASQGPYILKNTRKSDVNFYYDWAENLIQDGKFLGIHEPWVYPWPSLLVIVPPSYIGTNYQLAWAGMYLVTVTAAAVCLLKKTYRGYEAALYFLISAAVFAEVFSNRLEGVTVPLVTVGLTFLFSMPLVAGIILSVATWIKVWPFSLVAIICLNIAQFKKVIYGGILTTLFIVTVSYATQGITQLFSFLTYQGTRGVQIEAPLFSPWIYLANKHQAGYFVTSEQGLNSQNINGPGVERWSQQTAIILWGGGFLALLAVVAYLHLIRAWNHEYLLLSMGMGTSFFIVFNKVGSTQYVSWLFPVIAFALGTTLAHHRLWSILALAHVLCVFLSIQEYLLYTKVMTMQGGEGLLFLFLRNVLLILELVLMMWIFTKEVLAARRACSRVG